MVHRSPLAAADVDVINGIPVTKAARTLIDVAAVVHRDVVEEALDDALRRGLVSIGLLRGRLREVGGRGGRRGVTVMRELIEARVDEGVPQSVSKPGCSGSSRAVASPSLCSSTECRRLGGRLQLWILRFPRFELGSRPTGYRWHSGLARWRKDRRRGNELAGLGWRVIYITWDEIQNQPAQVVASIRRMLAGAEVLSPDAVISSAGDKTSGNEVQRRRATSRSAGTP